MSNPEVTPPYKPDVYENVTHSFVVKVWSEGQVSRGKLASWRGYIVHVPSGKQQYIQSLVDIAAFIAVYLRRLNVRLEFLWIILSFFRRSRIH